MDENVKMEGTPLTLEERLECQANEIRTKEQQIEQLKAENDHWQEICADLHIEYGDEIDQLKAQAAELHEALKWLKAISFSHEDDLTQWPAQDTREEVEHALSLGAGCDYHNPADTERINKLEQDYKDACKGRMIFFEEGASKNERIQALVSDKDQQAGRIIQYDTALKECTNLLNDSRDILKDLSGLFVTANKKTACTATLALIMIIDTTTKRVSALLGGAKDANTD